MPSQTSARVREAFAISREEARVARRQRTSCPICAAPGHPSFETRFVEVYRCEGERCAHLFAVDVDPHHGVMNASDGAAEASVYADRNERLIAFWEARRFLTGTAKLLDVGAGTGHLAQCLRERHPTLSIQCVEESAVLREQLESRGFAVAKDLDSIASDASFDAVLLIEVIEHVPEPVDFLHRLRSCLNPNGRIFLTTPCGELRNGSRSTNAYDTPEHVQFFTEKSLRLAIERAGFRGIRCEYIDALYPRTGRALSFAAFERIAKRALRPILAKFQGPRHLTGFIER